MNPNWLMIKRNGNEVVLESCSQDAYGIIFIPNEVTEIANEAFYGCNVEMVVIPHTVKFNGRLFCSRVVDESSGIAIYNDNPEGIILIECGVDTNGKMVVPYGVSEIDTMAFVNCSGLTSVIIPDSVNKIGIEAFRGCDGLSSVAIPNSVIKIGSSAFCACEKLSEVHYSGSIEQWCKIKFEYDDEFDFCANPLSYAHNLYVDGQLVTNMIIPDTITEIELKTFVGASCLQSVSIPNSVKKIGDFAFYGCSGLKYVVIPDSVASIGDYTFLECEGLELVVIPDSIKSIGKDVFEGCDNLTTVLVSKGSKEKIEKLLPKELWNKLLEDDGSHTICYDAAEKLDTEWIYENAIYNSYANGKGKIRLKNDVIEIGSRAFEGCCGLTYIEIPNSITYIGENAFNNTGWHNNQPDGILYLDGWCIGYKGAKPTGTLTIAKGTRCIAECAFSNCKELTSISIPDSVKSIGNCAFYNCKNLSSINMPNPIIIHGKTSCFHNTDLKKFNGVDIFGASDLHYIPLNDDGLLLFFPGEEYIHYEINGEECYVRYFESNYNKFIIAVYSDMTREVFDMNFNSLMEGLVDILDIYDKYPVGIREDGKQTFLGYDKCMGKWYDECYTDMKGNMYINGKKVDMCY